MVTCICAIKIPHSVFVLTKMIQIVMPWLGINGLWVPLLDPASWAHTQLTPLAILRVALNYMVLFVLQGYFQKEQHLLQFLRQYCQNCGKTVAIP